jgi:hypothetical protein
MLRRFVCWVMLVMVPVSLLGQSGQGQNTPGQAAPAPPAPASTAPGQSSPGQLSTGQSAPGQAAPEQGESGQTGAAILHAQGGVWVNGYEARDASAIFPGDLLETKPGSAANLSLDGTTVLMQPESVGKLQANLLELDHGSVLVGTSKGFKVRVSCITVVPVLNEWTQYEVTNVNGNVQVTAHKLDVNVERETDHKKPSPDAEASHGTTVHEGEQKSFDRTELCGAAPLPTTASTGLNPKWIAVGAAGAGALVCLLVCRGGKTPISSSSP